MSEERLMKTPEEVKQKARELLQMPKEEVLTKYMFQEQEIERLNNIINRTTKYVESLSSKGRGCDIYEDIKQEILQELKGVDKE